MEDMDIDPIVDIPDTPDRLASRNFNHGKFIRRESNSSVPRELIHSHFMAEESLIPVGRRCRVETDNGHHKRHHVHSRKTPCNLEEIEQKASVETGIGCNGGPYINPRKTPSNMEEIEHRNSTVILSPLEKPRNSLLVRKMAIAKNSKDEARHFIGAHHTDKGKSIHDGDHLVKQMTEGQIANTGGSYLHCASKVLTSGNSFKGKEKIDENTCKRVGSDTDNGREMDRLIGSEHMMEKEFSTSHHSLKSPRVSGQKRLVRNGCISPLNIATRAQQLADRNHQSTKAKDVEHNQITNMVPSPCVIDISDIVAEDINCERVKGKGVLIYPRTLKKHDTISNHFSSDTSKNNDEEPSGFNDANRDMVGRFEGLGGWISTCNHSRKIGHQFSDDAGRPGKNNEVGCFVNKPGNRILNRDTRSVRNYRDACHYQDNQDAASTLVSEHDRFHEPHLTTKSVVKKQKNESSSRNCGEFIELVSNDSKAVVLGSSGESSSSSSFRSQNHQHQAILDPMVEIDELSPEMRHSDSRGIGCINDDVSDARARQLEADEMLARELQEQLYHEPSIFGGGEIDANIAWLLQRENAFRAAPIRNPRVQNPRDSSRTHSYRHPLSRSFQNPSNGREAQIRVPSTRNSRLRSRIFSRSPAASSRARNFQFPLDMDLDMRLDILEALEAAVDDFTNIGIDSDVLQVQRDFNENDYEMLLALDENNHRHVGATVNQINSLPQSMVQTENIDEACAICLENPTIGETIRHLPCLHKFHKDCIDPWLSKKTSCPVCKSSIT